MGRTIVSSVSLRRMVVWHIILLLIFAITIRVHSQLDSLGFLSIDSGLTVNSSYVDNITKLYYVSDEQFINTGVNSHISSSYTSDSLPWVSASSLPKEFQTLRCFPTGIRNCYTIRSLTVGSKYLIRATFCYANYDNLNKPPIFDIYLGVNFWDTVNAANPYFPEIIFIATGDDLQVCLVNKNLGNPFISSLHLRQLNSRIYQYVNATQSLVWQRRANLGAGKNISLLRYPDDIHDRWWWRETFMGTIDMSTNSTIAPDPDFDTPSLVMQTAAITSNTTQPFVVDWSSNNESNRFYVILHFAEIQNTLSTVPRSFNIFANGFQLSKEPYSLNFLSSGFFAAVATNFTYYNISLVATSNSTLPPLMNGIELYKIAPMGVPTYDADVAAISSIKEVHRIKRDWNFDPCVPKEFIWNGVSCTSNSIPRITAINLSSSGLTGPLSYYFGSLSALVSLDLSSNDLSGALPSSLDQLTALTYLDIRGNSKISTTIPLGLQKKKQNGSLTYRFGVINPTPSPSFKKNIIIPIVVAVPLLVIAVVVATVFWLRKKRNKSIFPKPNESSESNPAAAQGFLDIDNRQFSFNDLKRITNDCKDNIGNGGFGSVYLGIIENGIQVAVKMRSNSSTQGVEELVAEAKNLARVHHKNLVKLVGYCIDENCMALVYEYMKEGDLQKKLKDEVRPLTWKQRLTIAYQSAQGLEYLHKACNPPLIHRDVKTTNILLNANLEAKIADFGLCRTIDDDAISYVLTRIIGTPGYVDPEYYLSNQLCAKSDVFSFGVVLLEIITGQPPTNAGVEGVNLVRWVREKLSGGDIESIVDPRMQDKYDINSVWKVTNLACKCTEFTSSERPTMAVVVSELKESLDLEISMEEMDNKSTQNLLTDEIKERDFKVASLGGIPTIGPCER